MKGILPRVHAGRFFFATEEDPYVEKIKSLENLLQEQQARLDEMEKKIS